jgi:hypothetical protein
LAHSSTHPPHTRTHARTPQTHAHIQAGTSEVSPMFTAKFRSDFQSKFGTDLYQAYEHGMLVSCMSGSGRVGGAGGAFGPVGGEAWSRTLRLSVCPSSSNIVAHLIKTPPLSLPPSLSRSLSNTLFLILLWHGSLYLFTPLPIPLLPLHTPLHPPSLSPPPPPPPLFFSKGTARSSVCHCSFHCKSHRYESD